MNTPFDSSTPAGLAWPLPGTRFPNAHLTWADWVARRAESGNGEPHSLPLVAAQTLTTELSSVGYLNHDITARLVWPLPGTKLPHFRVSSTQWIDMLRDANGICSQQPEPAAPARAA